MLLKLSPLILLIVAIAAIILRVSGVLGSISSTVILAVVIVCGIAIGFYRSHSSRHAGRSN
jgi:hypothetical protein